MSGQIDEITEELENIKQYVDFDGLVKKKEVLEKKLVTEWSKDHIEIEKEKILIIRTIDKIQKFESDLVFIKEFSKIQTDQEIFEELQNLYDSLLKYKLSLYFSTEDQKESFIEIQSGAGGTEAQDWAEMLLNMYVSWAKTQGKYNIISVSQGEEAGIKNALLKVSVNSYGLLKYENGIHRLVRISPFNAQGKRQTSFASVCVYPVQEDTISISINESDLRIDTYKSSGCGGQSVNTTDSAVRITHIPTGIVVQCQNERSQHKNKDIAMSVLKSRLYSLELAKQDEAKNSVEKHSIGWGNQIRSYVLNPSQMVKDNRSGFETANAFSILEGKIDSMLEYNLIKLSKM